MRANDLAAVPCVPGVYLVFRPSNAEPAFVHPSPAGTYQGRDPTVSVERLRDCEWVADAQIVYIGKADYRKRRTRSEALRQRLDEYGRFGAGEDNVAHYGGRFIWQLADADEVLVAWQEITWAEKARRYEKRLLRRFGELYAGRRPFANLTW